MEPRVLMVSAAYSPCTHFGGLDTAVAGVANALEARGADVRVAMPAYKDYYGNSKFMNAPPADRRADGTVRLITTVEEGVPVNHIQVKDWLEGKG